MSALKAFAKHVTQGYYNFLIVDNVNAKVADFDQYWGISKNTGFEVYVCEMEESDIPVPEMFMTSRFGLTFKVCAKQNVHNYTRRQIQAIKDTWEPTPRYFQSLSYGVRNDTLIL